MKWQATDWKTILTIRISDKWLVFRISSYKVLLQINKEKNNSIKNEQKTWTDTSLKKIYECPVSTGKGAQHH